MSWTVGFLDDGVEAVLSAMPVDIRAAFQRIVELITAHGLERVREPYVKHLAGAIWEFRMRGKDGIARAAYVTASGRRIVIVHVFEEGAADTASTDRDRPAKGQGGDVIRKFIPVDDTFRQWEQNPDFRAAYDALDEEFTLAGALIKARLDAEMTQEQVARAMGTTQAAIARLESGRMATTTRTLERYARATGMRLRIIFEPETRHPAQP